jgi:hypothetical protein
VRRVLFIAFAFTLGALLTGCGEEGVSSGATVAVYVSGESLCEGARQELSGSNERAGSFRVRMICLDDPGTLSSTGANARRATEDSTTVGYITAPSPRLTSFSRAILDAANIAQLSTSSGATAMARLLRAIRQASTSGRLREAVFDELR